jgi:hypothetical protein
LSPQSYSTLTTSSANWITCSFNTTNAVVVIGKTGSYNFTCSNLPASGIVSEHMLYVANQSTLVNSCSLSFPSNWTFVGVKPLYLPISKSMALSLKAYGTSYLLAIASITS